MKKSIYFLTSTILLTIAIGCSNQEPAISTKNSQQKTYNPITQENINDTEILNVKQIATEFKQTELEVSNYNKSITPDWIKQRKSKLEPLMTTNFLKKQADNRKIALPLQIASLEKTTLSIEDLQIQEKSVTKKNIDLTYSVTLMLKDKNKKIPLEDQLTFIKENGKWKVNNDIYNANKFQEILDKHKRK
ncbi:hypothetical protein ACN92M_10235 [Paenibacillus polymyxa]|uniref:hypothetical protein n=1 Tax=Paenibacillus polymyxa TaxID=1406 RepID=UPI003B5B0BBB